MTLTTTVYLVVIAVLAAALVALYLDRKRLRSLTDELKRERDRLGDARDESAALANKLEQMERATDLPALDKRVAHLKRERDTWEHKFWQQHGLIEKCLGQRDVWKDMYGEHVSEHLEGQSALEDKIVKLRQNLVRALATINKMRLDADPEAELVKGPNDLLPLDGAPVGQAERYYERMKKLLQQTAPQAFDALLERDRITVDTGSPHLYRVRERVVRARQLQEAERLETNAGALRGHAGDWVVTDGSTKRLVPQRMFEHWYEPVGERSAGDDDRGRDDKGLRVVESKRDRTARKSASKREKIMQREETSRKGK